jgi:hypothetical protein
MSSAQYLPDKEYAMRRTGPISIAAAAVLVVASTLAAATASAADAHHGKRAASRPGQGVGFLPGYEPPEVVEWRRDFQRRPPAFWYGGPRYYRGRWNGGGFGPCWTQTPIGNHWSCG